jgi:hypothetical protein
MTCYASNTKFLTGSSGEEMVVHIARETDKILGIPKKAALAGLKPRIAACCKKVLPDNESKVYSLAAFVALIS